MMTPYEQVVQTLELAAAREEAARLRAALESFLEHYVDMVESGDCGNWNPEKDDVVVMARAALAGSAAE